MFREVSETPVSLKKYLSDAIMKRDLWLKGLISLSHLHLSLTCFSEIVFIFKSLLPYFLQAIQAHLSLVFTLKCHTWLCNDMKSCSSAEPLYLYKSNGLFKSISFLTITPRPCTILRSSMRRPLTGRKPQRSGKRA